MKFISSAAILAVLVAMSPAMATPQPQEGRGTLPDLIILRFIGGKTIEVSNPSSSVGGQPHEVVAAENGIPLSCQAWKEGTSRKGYGFVAEITQICN